MPNQYWARKAIKTIAAAYPDREVRGEIFDLGSRAGVWVDGVLLNLNPADTDPLAKAIALYGDPP